MLDMYGTPYTRALQVVERYRMLDYEAAREGLERDSKESLVIPAITIPGAVKQLLGTAALLRKAYEKRQKQFTGGSGSVFTISSVLY